MGLKEKLAEKPVLGFVLAMQDRYGRDRGNYLAAVITYYGFLSLFPLLLLGFSIVGFVLAGDPEAQRRLADSLAGAIPGLEAAMGDNIDALVDARAATGLIGVAGLLWSGLGATEAAGFAVSRVFRVRPYKTFLKKKAWALGVTVGLGVLALSSLAGVAIVGNISLEGAGGVALQIGTLLLGVALDLGLFLIAYRVLTQRLGPPFPRLWRGALFAAIVWGLLKVIGTWYVARTVAGSTAVYGAFASAVGILLLIYLASRVLIYGAEINAVAMEREGHVFGPMERDAFAPAREAEGGGRVTARPMERNGDRSTGEIVKSLAGDTATLVRKEIELARQEVVEGIMAKVKGAGAFAGAAFFGLVGVILLAITLGVSLAIILPAWLAWLLSAVIFFALAAIAAAVGRGMIAKSSVAPEKTKETVKEDVAWAKAQLKR